MDRLETTSLDPFEFVKQGYRLLNVFVDADACPVKQEVYRVAARYHIGGHPGGQLMDARAHRGWNCTSRCRRWGR